MDIERAKLVVNGRMWQPGQSGNPNGRQVGSRSAFSAGFTRDLAEVWAEKSKASMRSNRRRSLRCALGYYRMTFGLRSSSPCRGI